MSDTSPVRPRSTRQSVELTQSVTAPTPCSTNRDWRVVVSRRQSRDLTLKGRLRVMNLDDVMRTVRGSEPSDWARVERAPGLSDPFTNEFVLRADPTITLQFGAPHNDGKGWDHEDWSHSLADQKIYGVYAEVRVNGVAVFSELLISADGFRVYLPSGRPLDGYKRMGVTVAEAEFARLIDRLLQPHSDFDGYMARLPFEIL